jgi:hypothetical protein
MSNLKFKFMALCMFFAICQTEINAQNFCYTPSESPDIMQSFSAQSMLTPNASYEISVFFHIIRQTNGIGGFTVADVNNAFSIINNDYNSHGIFFCLAGIDEIKNDNSL